MHSNSNLDDGIRIALASSSDLANLSFAEVQTKAESFQFTEQTSDYQIKRIYDEIRAFIFQNRKSALGFTLMADFIGRIISHNENLCERTQSKQDKKAYLDNREQWQAEQTRMRNVAERLSKDPALRQVRIHSDKSSAELKNSTPANTSETRAPAPVVTQFSTHPRIRKARNCLIRGKHDEAIQKLTGLDFKVTSEKKHIGSEIKLDDYDGVMLRVFSQRAERDALLCMAQNAAKQPWQSLENYDYLPPGMDAEHHTFVADKLHELLTDPRCQTVVAGFKEHLIRQRILALRAQPDNFNAYADLYAACDATTVPNISHFAPATNIGLKESKQIEFELKEYYGTKGPEKLSQVYERNKAWFDSKTTVDISREDKEKNQQELNFGIQALAERKFQLAEEIFKTVNERFGREDVFCHMMLAVSCVLLSKFSDTYLNHVLLSQALEFLNKAIQRSQENGNGRPYLMAHSLRGYVYLSQNNDQAACKDFVIVRDDCAKHTDFCSAMSVKDQQYIHKWLLQYEAVVQEAQKKASDPEYCKTESTKYFKAARDQKELDKKVEYYTRAFIWDKDNPKILLKRAAVFIQQKEFRRAVTDFKYLQDQIPPYQPDAEYKVLLEFKNRVSELKAKEEAALNQAEQKYAKLCEDVNEKDFTQLKKDLNNLIKQQDEWLAQLNSNSRYQAEKKSSSVDTTPTAKKEDKNDNKDINQKELDRQAQNRKARAQKKARKDRIRQRAKEEAAIQAAAQKAEAERKAAARQAQEKREAENAAKRAEAERLAEIKRQALAKQLEDERRQAQEKKQAEEKKKQIEKTKRLALEKQQADEAKKAAAEAKQLMEEKKKAESAKADISLKQQAQLEEKNTPAKMDMRTEENTLRAENRRIIEMRNAVAARATHFKFANKHLVEEITQFAALEQYREAQLAMAEQHVQDRAAQLALQQAYLAQTQAAQLAQWQVVTHSTAAIMREMQQYPASVPVAQPAPSLPPPTSTVNESLAPNLMEPIATHLRLIQSNPQLTQAEREARLLEQYHEAGKKFSQRS